MLLDASLSKVTSLGEINSHFRMKWTLLYMYRPRQVHLLCPMIIVDMYMIVTNLSKRVGNTELAFWFTIVSFVGFSGMRQNIKNYELNKFRNKWESVVCMIEKPVMTAI